MEAYKFNGHWHVIRDDGKLHCANPIENDTCEKNFSFMEQILRTALDQLVGKSFNLSGQMPYIPGSQKWSQQDLQDWA